MPNNFLERAYQLRSKYFPENKGFLSQEQTKYNAKKIKEHLCEMCGIEVGNDVHHLAEQKEANKNGFIGTFHKNHPANLMTICKNCHQLEHGKQTIFC
jgi:DNA mismatch repair protein MutS